MAEQSDKSPNDDSAFDASRATPTSNQTAGHRRRMRDRLLDKGAHTLTELELLEMILYGSNPRGDTKPLAKTLMKKFGSLSSILRAPPTDLLAIKNIGEAAVANIKIAETAALHLSHSDIKNRSVLSSWAAVKHYCINRLAHQNVEIFMMISLDNQNKIIEEDEISRGTIDQTPVYVREVINIALRNGAKSVIIVHNHPSGETYPSAADIHITEELRKALGIMSMSLHDHLIVAGAECVSLKSLGHI